jgi:hypothetical protein
MRFGSTHRLVNSLGAAVCCTLLASAVSADDNHNPPRGHGPRKPPQEAYDACADLSQGDDCQVKIHDWTIDGSCERDRDEGKLFCRPDQPPGPPPGALKACENKSEGDACTLTRPDGNSGPSGSCAKGPDGQLGCRPSGPPRG